MKIRLFAAWFSICYVAVACTGTASPPDGTDPVPQLRALTQSERQIASANSNFGLKLFQQAVQFERGRNMFVSPLSYSLALGMAYNGAAGATADSMARALELQGLNRTEANAAYKSLLQLLLSTDPKVEFRIANSVWYNQRFIVVPTFLDLARQNFDAEVRAMDFASPATRTTINSWVEQKTNNRIKDLIQQDFRADDLMALVNAVYFNGTWKTRFDSTNTRPDTFTDEAGKQIPCPMMNFPNETTLNVLRTPDFTAVNLPYGNGQFTMTLVLPQTGRTLNNVVSRITPAVWSQVLTNTATTATMLALPKFKMETRYEETRGRTRELHALGMGLAFSDLADFSNLYAPPLRAHISFVIHQTFLQVDERGTEAAAATAVGIRLTSSNGQPNIIRFDRPFAFFISEKNSQTMLFAGTLHEPKF